MKEYLATEALQKTQLQNPNIIGALFAPILWIISVVWFLFNTFISLILFMILIIVIYLWIKAQPESKKRSKNSSK